MQKFKILKLISRLVQLHPSWVCSKFARDLRLTAAGQLMNIIIALNCDLERNKWVIKPSRLMLLTHYQLTGP